MILEKCIVYWKYILKTWRGSVFKHGKWYNEICIRQRIGCTQVDWKERLEGTEGN